MVAVLVLLTVLAADQVTDISGELIKYGLAGIVIVAIIFGYLNPKPYVDALKSQNALLLEQLNLVSAQRDAMIKNYEEAVIPVLTEVQRDLVPTLRQAAGQLKEAGQQLEALRKSNDAMTEELRRKGLG